ncbi:39S ribosomal protein L37, mitochondrial-like [Ctenocephalides felis]|uniref:39S ribosomal protein L37, mitochondrial-like n=1 Tax=Ctenocephalides felis TaxID=7515 RepID=UPI000E6E3E13|nr:39S ribosomal protein L37, mitochondrial-like [Ctenocephalides felis]
MRLITVLRAQHLDRMFKKHWVIQGRRKIIETGAEAALTAKGIPVIDASEAIKEKRQIEKIDVIGIIPKPIAFDETHPNYHERKCHFFRDHNVLLEGVKQSLVVTKSIQLKENSLPEHLENEISNTEVPNRVHDLVKRAIFSANVFDTEQEKLPKVTDPLRPAFNFPRRLGISDHRRNFILSSKLLRICEMSSNIFSERNVLKNAYFSLCLEKDSDLIQFEINAENFVITDKPLKPVVNDVAKTEAIELYNMFPIKSTITMPQENIYELNDVYPLTQVAKMDAPHTILLNFTPTYVHNLYETPVTTDQTLGRSMIKSFTIAAAYAKKKYGDAVEILPQPITVQCIQTDGRLFDFSVFQLNTLNINGNEGIKNIWYQTEQMPLYNICTYEKGVPP